jgi:hypothetical protein
VRFKMRFSIRTLLVTLTLFAIGLGVWFARGRWLVSTLIDNGNHKPSWHSILRYNGLDPETNYLRGQPKGVWRVTDSKNSIVWVMTKHNSLTAISPDGVVKDLGGIVSPGNPTPLWTGKTPDGRSGIVLVSKDSSPDAENYLMFVTFDGRSRARLIVTINTWQFETNVSEKNGWPIVRLATNDQATAGHFSFPECKSPTLTTENAGANFWNLIYFD